MAVSGMIACMARIAKALVVGGGIGGMAAAIRLLEHGTQVDLIDSDPYWRVYGAGITITAPTMRAYSRLGLLDAIKAEGAITKKTRIYRYDGTLLYDMDEPGIEEGLPGTGGILRPILHRIMQGRVQALAANVRLGVTVDAFVESDSGVDVTFSDGSKSGYDLVIGADGVASRVRSLAFPHMGAPQPTGQGCWRITTQRPPGLEFGEFYLGYKIPAGISACGPDTVYLWVLTEDKDQAYIPESELHRRLRMHIADFGGNVAWMRDQMTAQTWINYRPLSAAIQPRPWHTRRIVLLGDAAHATSPHLACGAGMAVESALVLADELNGADRSLVDSLAAYEERRYERCRLVVQTGIEVGNMQLQGGSPQVVGGMIGAALHKLAAPF